ncbi:MAG: NADH-quinone oxidoreductase subunit C [Euryarchaeota archaeon]|nr:NADH-quinone oxidoreductase subunit C [Euryarchaeota archaeon]
MTNNTDEQLKEILQQNVQTDTTVTLTKPHRIMVTVARESLKKTMNILATKLSAQHLSTITARDTGTIFEILYHFFIQGSIVTIRTSCPRDDPTVESIVDIFPSATLHEREMNDILGIIAIGHPDLRRLILPEDWNQGYPLRKDWKPSGGDMVG